MVLSQFFYYFLFAIITCCIWYIYLNLSTYLQIKLFDFYCKFANLIELLFNYCQQYNPNYFCITTRSIIICITTTCGTTSSTVLIFFIRIIRLWYWPFGSIFQWFSVILPFGVVILTVTSNFNMIYLFTNLISQVKNFASLLKIKRLSINNKIQSQLNYQILTRRDLYGLS